MTAYAIRSVRSLVYAVFAIAVLITALLLSVQGTPSRLRAYGSSVTTMVSVASDGTQGAGNPMTPAISADRRYVAFSANDVNLVPGDTNNETDIFVHDLQSGQTARASVASDGSQSNGGSESPAISADGRYVAFASTANNLVSGDTNPITATDVFLHDMQTRQTTRVSVASDGSQGDGSSGGPSISGDGRYVAFWSLATNLVPGDTNGFSDVFVHDLQTAQTTRVSVASDGSQANNSSSSPSISGGGRYIAFDSSAKNLVPGDTTKLTYEVFVHDMQNGQTTRVSLSSNGTPGDGDSQLPAISADGRYVAFQSIAGNLVPGDRNGANDVFVHDRLTGWTSRVSVASDGTEANGTVRGGGSNTSAISGDGRFVAFKSDASNLVPGNTPFFQIYIHDQGDAPLSVLYIPLAIQGISPGW